MSIEQTLASRMDCYGDFTEQSRITQELKAVMKTGRRYDELSHDKSEALSMIASKIARILNGNPNYADSWHDIAGYAKLAEDRCVNSVPLSEEDAYYETELADYKEKARSLQEESDHYLERWRHWQKEAESLETELSKTKGLLEKSQQHALHAQEQVDRAMDKREHALQDVENLQPLLTASNHVVLTQHEEIIQLKAQLSDAHSRLGYPYIDKIEDSPSCPPA